jgi:hypothetical protein
VTTRPLMPLKREKKMRFNIANLPLRQILESNLPS